MDDKYYLRLVMKDMMFTNADTGYSIYHIMLTTYRYAI